MGVLERCVWLPEACKRPGIGRLPGGRGGCVRGAGGSGGRFVRVEDVTALLGVVVDTEEGLWDGCGNGRNGVPLFAESWPSRINRGRSPLRVFEFRCKGGGLPFSSRRANRVEGEASMESDRLCDDDPYDVDESPSPYSPLT